MGLKLDNHLVLTDFCKIIEDKKPNLSFFGL